MGETVVDARELTRTFGDFTAVDRVSFEVSSGEIFGYLGSNGAGKSTTIRMLTGLLAPSSGTAIVVGHDVAEQTRQVKRAIGYMSQKFSLYMDLSVEENLAFFAGAYDLSGEARKRRIEAALELAGLVDERSALTGTLPGGIRQRLALGSALLHEPKLVFLDEPTAGVDPSARREFWRVIRQLARDGTTVFVTTHHLDEAEYCHRIGLMDAGELVALDTPSELKQQYVPETVYEVDAGTHAKALHQKLEDTNAVTQVQPFGNQLHVYATDALKDLPRFRQLVEDRAGRDGAGGRIEVEEIEPTLEDVFLRVMARREEESSEEADR